MPTSIDWARLYKAVLDPRRRREALRDAAIYYGTVVGWRIGPAKEQGQTPAHTGWQAEATAAADAIRDLWSRFPYNILLPTGVPSDTLVIDDDGDPEGFLAPVSPDTPAIMSRRGPKYLFNHIDGLKNSVSLIAPKVDVRTTGGLVILPPSIHPTGVVYQWKVWWRPTVAPDWLLERLREIAQPKRSNSDRALAAAGMQLERRSYSGLGYGRAAILGEADAVAAQRQPGRNARLNIAAYNLGRLVGGDEISEADWATEVVPRLIAACQHNGLLADDGEAKCLATIESGFKAGVQRPRTRRAA